MHIGAPIDLQASNASCFGNIDAKIVFTKNSTIPYDITWRDQSNNIISLTTNVIGADSLSNITSGAYYIETTDALCGNQVDTITINEPNQIIAQFTSDVDTVYLSTGGIVNFTNLSSNATSFNWNFGDLNSSNLVSPTHQYSSAGDYFVTLNSTQSNICFDTYTKKITVLNIPSTIDEQPPIGNIKAWIENNTLIVKGLNTCNVFVRNTLGQELFNSSNKINHFFNLSKLSSQIIILNFVHEKSYSSTKVNFIKK